MFPFIIFIIIFSNILSCCETRIRYWIVTSL